MFKSVDFNQSNYIDYSEFIAANLETFEIANDKKLEACFAKIDKVSLNKQRMEMDFWISMSFVL